MGVVVGQTLGSYRILRRMGRGGMGEVYAAHDECLGRKVALKVLLPEVAADPERLQRFEREAKLVAALDHPNIVTIFTVESAEETRFFTMELVDGAPLVERIPETGLEVDRIFEIAVPLTDALAAAHARGIVHRDLKPANVMLGNDGRVRVLDFGLAKLLAREDAEEDLTSAPTAAAETQEGLTLGTVGYMSPEQVKGQSADARSDVFSLGVLLFEMALGYRPFQGESAPEVLSAILRDTPPAVDSCRRELPHHLGRIVRRCLEKDPDRRYASAREVHAEFADLAAEIRTESLLAEHGGAGAPIEAPGRRGKPLWIAAAAGIALTLIVLLWQSLGPDNGERRGAEGMPIESLAVLPFDNLMNDPGQEFFVEGVHEALITDLSKIGALRVISRTSTMRYRESGLSLPEIAAELGVDALIEGSVLRADGQVRVTAQLIDGATDEHLWADAYDRELEDILALLSEIAQAIAREIEITLTPDQQHRLAATHAVDPEAYELLLKGRHYFNRGDFEGFREALGLQLRTVEVDPEFAGGWAELAATYLVHGFFRLSSPTEVIPKARGAARRALDLDDTQGGAHQVLGYIALFFDWDWRTAKRELELGLELDPTDTMAHHTYADYLGVMGDCEASVRQVRRGRHHDPMGVWANLFVIGHLTYCGHFQEAEAEGRRILAMGVESPGIRDFLAEALWLQGRHEDALAEWREAWGPDSPMVQAYETGFATGGADGAMRAAAESAAAAAHTDPINPVTVALTYGAAGQADEAFTWLETAYERRTPQLLHITFHPRLDPIRDDPRFDDLLRRIGIPQPAGGGV